MTGYALMTASCYGCGRMFTSNPIRVPSFSPTGRHEDREPICFECITIVNRQRQAAGLPTWSVSPDAYEPVDEAELS